MATAGANPIRAQLIGSDTCSALGITVCAYAPVLSLCRKLIAAGVDPDRQLHAYRGDVLCLVIHSIGEAAGLRVNTKGTAFIKRECAVPTASPMRREGAL